MNRLFVALCLNVFVISSIIACNEKPAENRSSTKIIPPALKDTVIIAPPNFFATADNSIIIDRFLVPYDEQMIATIKKAFDKFCDNNERSLRNSTKLQDSCKKVQALQLETLLHDRECIAAVNAIHTEAMNTDEYRSIFWYAIRRRTPARWEEYRDVLKILHRKFLNVHIPEIHLPAISSKDPAADFITQNAELNDPKALAAFLLLEALPIQIQRNYRIPFE